MVAAADRDDEHNRACTDLLTGLHLAGRQLLVPAPVVAEVGYLLGRAGGVLRRGRVPAVDRRAAFAVVDLQVVDYDRMADLVETYADFPLGTTDLAVVAVAERLGISEIATLDRRHFHAVPPRHTAAFTIVP
ncbi:MAG: type II toxin-antitoxin system VapC family toxin [Pseudonocardia sp.]